jgi:hypothetical protein
MTTPPDQVTGVTITNIMPTSLTISWTMPNPNGWPISRYDIEYSQGDSIDSDPSNHFLQNATGLTANISNFLLPGQDYTFTVSAWNGGGSGGGEGPASDPLTITMLAGGWIRVDGVWKVCIPYVRHSGTWKMALPWIRTGGIWKQTH